MKLLRHAAITLFSVLMLWLALSSAVGIYAVEGALHPGHYPLTDQREFKLDSEISSLNATHINVDIPANDGIALHAWFIAPPNTNGNAVLLLHGQGDNRQGMEPIARLLIEHGYSVLMPDSRAHGESGGPIATYGILENSDILTWVRWLRVIAHPNCINAIGDSMGAALALNSLQDNPGFCAVIADSPFDSFQQAAYTRMAQYFGLSIQTARILMAPAIQAGTLYVRARYGINLAAASPETAAANSHTPILLIHGMDDSNLPYWHSQLIAQRAWAAHRELSLWLVPHAEHCGAFDTEPDNYQRRVLDWLRSHNKMKEKPYI